MKHFWKTFLTRIYLLKNRFKWLRGIGRTGSIFYIGGAESLPQPLSPEEELRLLYHYGVQEVRRFLFERYLRLVV